MNYRHGDSFGEMLRRRRLELGLTLREVCQSLSISPPYLSDIERDRRLPAKAKLDGLAKILGIEPDDLHAMSGKFDERLWSYMKRQPLMSKLINRIVEKNISDGGLQELIAMVEKIDAKRSM